MIHSIPGFLEVTWNADIRAIVDTWSNYNVPLDQFRDAVLGKGLDHAKANNGQAWIVDSSKATGNFTAEIQTFIAQEVFRSFSENGIKYFLTITSESALTNLTILQYNRHVGPHGITLVEATSTDEAIAWLKESTLELSPSL